MRKNKRRLSSIDETKVSYLDFIEIVGDKPISDYTRNDARDYRNIISNTKGFISFLILADFKKFSYHWIVDSFKAVVEPARFHPEGRLEASP